MAGGRREMFVKQSLRVIFDRHPFANPSNALRATYRAWVNHFIHQQAPVKRVPGF